MSNERKCLSVATTSKQIHDNPLNNSPSKQQFSFPHDERFRYKNIHERSLDKFYDVNGMLFRNKKTCSFGIGGKYDFTRNAKNVPAPNAYYPQNLSINESKKQGFSFGISRDNAPQNSIIPSLAKSL